MDRSQCGCECCWAETKVFRGTAAPPLDIGVLVFDDACQAACPDILWRIDGNRFYPTKTVGGAVMVDVAHR